MANRNVDTELWNDPKITDDLTPEDKYFWLFLLTTKYGNLSGCFELTPKQIARDMGYSEDTANNLIYRFINLHKMISYDFDTREVLIHNWYKYNWTKSPKFEVSLFNFINKIKSDDLKEIVISIYENYKNGDTVSIPYRYGSISISNTKTISNTNEEETKKDNVRQEIEKEIELDKELDKDKKNNKGTFLYYENEDLNNLFNEFLNLRKKLKAVNTERAVSLLLGKLEPYSDEIKEKMIEQSITNSWKGLFPIKVDFVKEQKKPNKFENIGTTV